jgi:hypothetical protein
MDACTCILGWAWLPFVSTWSFVFFKKKENKDTYFLKYNFLYFVIEDVVCMGVMGKIVSSVVGSQNDSTQIPPSVTNKWHFLCG